MKQLKKVLIIAHIFPPLGGSGVQRTLKFVKYLEANGWQPTVVTVGKSQYPLIDETLVAQIPQNIEIIKFDEPDKISFENVKDILSLLNGVVSNKNVLKEYLEVLNANKDNLINLIMPDQYLIWANVVLDNLDKKIDAGNFDAIYSTSGPYSAHLIGYYLKEKYNKPWVMDIRDEWSNNPYFQVKDKENIFYRTSVEIEREILQKADKVITTTPLTTQNYIGNFRLDQEKVITITNGYDEDDFLGLEEVISEKKKFTIVHNGLFYSIRTPDTLLRAVHNLISKKLVDRNLIKLVFTWSENDSSWVELINELKLEDVIEIKGYLNHKESLNLAYNSNVLLLVVGPDDKNNGMYPGKIFEYLRLQKPIISLAPLDGIVEKLIHKNKRGQNVDFYDIKGIEDTVSKYYQKWIESDEEQYPVNHEIKLYERRNLTKKLAGVFDESVKIFNQKLQSKSNLKRDIEETINNGHTQNAREQIAIYISEYGYDLKLYSWLGIVSILENDTESAISYFKEGLKFDNENMELHYNLGYSYLHLSEAKLALQHYKKAFDCCEDDTVKNEIKLSINQIFVDYPEITAKQKLVFFSIKNGDKFLHDIIDGLKEKYEIRKIIVTNLKQVDEGMKWADICWFEWCDQLVAYGSKLSLAKEKKIICRLHSYEAFYQNFTQEVLWENVDKVIFVAEFIRDIVLKKEPSLTLEQTLYIPNGINFEKFKFNERTPGFKIAYVCSIDFKKGPMLLLHSFKSIYDVDNRYELHIAGEFIEPRYKLYYDQMVKELGLENNVFYHGFQTNIPKWLEDKNYIISTSVLESQHLAIMEAMAMGIKPLVHNFYGAREIYENKFIWNTINEAVKMINKENYHSYEYRKFIEDNYSLEKQLTLTNEVLDSIVQELDFVEENFFDEAHEENDSNIYRFNCKNEIVYMYLPNKKDYIQNTIQNSKKFYESDMLEDIYKRDITGKTVIDIGANIGNHTIYFSKVAKAKKVYSFEPFKEVLKILTKNIEINNVEERVQIFDAAVGRKTSKATIDIVDERNLGMNKVCQVANGEVDVVTLDEVLLPIVDSVDVIKIDVEGMGLDVLYGSIKIIERFNPDIYIEAETDSDFQEISTILSNYNYKPIKRYNWTPTYLFSINP